LHFRQKARPIKQGRKSGSKITEPVFGWVEDSVVRSTAETSELPNHSCSAPLLGLFGDGWAAFFVTDSLLQDQPDQATLSMSNCPDGLVMPQTGD
jgi:hypothetical protein